MTDTEGLTYLVYALSSITLTASAEDKMIKSDGTFNGVLRLAKLNENGHQALLDNHSSVYPTSASLQYELGDRSGAIVFTWDTVGSGELLMLTWPHHRKVMQSPNFPPTSSLGYLTTKV